MAVDPVINWLCANFRILQDRIQALESAQGPSRVGTRISIFDAIHGQQLNYEIGTEYETKPEAKQDVDYSDELNQAFCQVNEYIPEAVVSDGGQVFLQMNACIPEVAEVMHACTKETGLAELFSTNSCADDVRHEAKYELKNEMGWAQSTTTPLSARANEQGAQAPAGFWDPFRPFSDGDVSVLKRRRETDIKHGRVSMLATMGCVAPELAGKLPGYLSPPMGRTFEDGPSGLTVIAKVPVAGWAQMVAYGFLRECTSRYGEHSPSLGECDFGAPLLAADGAELKSEEPNAEPANRHLEGAVLHGSRHSHGMCKSGAGVQYEGQFRHDKMDGDPALQTLEEFLADAAASPPLQPKPANYMDFADPWMNCSILSFNPLNMAVSEGMFDTVFSVVPETECYSYRESEVKHGRFAITAFLALFFEEADRSAVLDRLGAVGATDTLDGASGLDEWQGPALAIALGLQAVALSSADHQ